MLILKTIALIVFYFGFPVVIIYATQKFSLLNKIGTVVLAYIFGLLIGNSGLFPQKSDALLIELKGKAGLPAEKAMQLFEQGIISASDLTANRIATIQDLLISVVILLAIPLLLFSLEIKKWIKIAPGAFLSLILAISSLIAAILIGNFFYKDLIPESWKVAGMLVGLYTGGTPNLAAISTALKIDANTFLLTHTYDMISGAVCLVFLMTAAQRVFNLFLPGFDKKYVDSGALEKVTYDESVDSFVGILTRLGIIEVMKAFGFSSIILAIGGGLGMLVPEHSQTITVILSITTLGILFSNWKIVNRIEYSFQFGMYLIIVFSLIVASMGNLSEIFHIAHLHLFSYVVLVLFGSIFIHVSLSKIFNIDTDTTIITITALAYSPPFVPVVAGALKNKNIIISGLTVGIFGYAIGNYLGIAMAYFLE